MGIRRVKRTSGGGEQKQPEEARPAGPPARELKPEGKPAAERPRARQPVGTTPQRRPVVEGTGSTASTEVRQLPGATEVTVTLGEERLAPYQFNSFSVPQLSVRISLEPGDDVAAAVDAAFAFLRMLQREQFEAALEAHCKHVAEASMRAGGQP